MVLSPHRGGEGGTPEIERMRMMALAELMNQRGARPADTQPDEPAYRLLSASVLDKKKQCDAGHRNQRSRNSPKAQLLTTYCSNWQDKQGAR